MTGKRQSNFELLRIVSMIMIVAHHFSTHSGFSFPEGTVSANMLWVQFISIGGKLGVNIFVLISGYFLVTSPKIKISKAIKLWLQMFTYSVILCAVFVIPKLANGGGRYYCISELIKSALPVLTEQWWFASTYFLLYIFSPFINIFLKSLDKRTYKAFLLLMTVFWSVLPTLFRIYLDKSNFVWFIYVYSLAGYIRLWKDDVSVKNRVWFGLSAVMLAVIYGETVVCDILGTKVAFFGKLAGFFNGMFKLPLILLALFLFLGFKGIKIGYSRVINTISAATFGVYLIHDNNFVRPFLWITFLNNAQYADSTFLIPYSVLVICAVYIVCTVIELIRINVLEKRYMRQIYKLDSFLEKLKNKIFKSKIVEKI